MQTGLHQTAAQMKRGVIREAREGASPPAEGLRFGGSNRVISTHSL